MDTAYNSPIHRHPLFFSSRFILSQCVGCHVTEIIYGGYFCNETYCNAWFHKECAEAPPKINHHPSHPEHPLLLTNDSQMKDDPCDCCGQKLLSPCYTCLTCEFKVDLICGMKPSPPAIEHPVCHDHSFVFLKKREVEVPCEVCKESIGGPSYSCIECDVYFHLDCVHLSKEINHHCHTSHPPKLISSESLTVIHDAEKRCHFCLVQPDKVLYHCSICNFTMCVRCTKHPPPLVVEDPKTHKHPLWIFPSKILFTCKICGKVRNNHNSYICFQCYFFVDAACIGLPRVININRHDHRISFTDHHGFGRTECGVCRENVNQYCGAYIFSVCSSYVVHSRCAFDYDLWNGLELEGIPEINENVTTFKVVGHNLIRHFSHEKHTLRLLNDNVTHDDEHKRCEACISPVGFGPIYSCNKCLFILHEKCANLPMKKKLVFDPEPYKLECFDSTTVYCMLCGMFFDGFRYTSQGLRIFYHYVDVHCGSLSEPFVHNQHPHHLYFAKAKKDSYCDGCKRVPDDFMLSCNRECNFNLCMYCATLPEKIWHMSDEHPLTLSCDKNASSSNWCGVCESELDTSKWFFTCSDCGLALHVQCLLGDFSRLRQKRIYTFEGRKYKVVLNNRNTRPFCRHCHSRCKVSVILKDIGKDNGYICSISCLSSLLGINLQKRLVKTLDTSYPFHVYQLSCV